MLWITKDKELNLEDYGYILKTADYQQLPTVRNTKVNVIGRDGDVLFTDGYNNKTFNLKLTAIDSANIIKRRANARLINQEFKKEGKLVLDYENDIYYNARILNGTRVNFSASYDEVYISLDVDPFAISRIEGQIVWEEADYSWDLLNIPWEGYSWEFDIDTSDTIIVNNRGNVESLPIITIETTSSEDVTLTLGDQEMTYTGLNGIVNIDCKNMIVYDDSLTNAIENFSYSGDKFIELSPGENSIDVTGTCNIKFSKKDWFI